MYVFITKLSSQAVYIHTKSGSVSSFMLEMYSTTHELILISNRRSSHVQVKIPLTINRELMRIIRHVAIYVLVCYSIGLQSEFFICTTYVIELDTFSYPYNLFELFIFYIHVLDRVQ